NQSEPEGDSRVGSMGERDEPRLLRSMRLSVVSIRGAMKNRPHGAVFARREQDATQVRRPETGGTLCGSADRAAGEHSRIAGTPQPPAGDPDVPARAKM